MRPPTGEGIDFLTVQKFPSNSPSSGSGTHHTWRRSISREKTIPKKKNLRERSDGSAGMRRLERMLCNQG